MGGFLSHLTPEKNETVLEATCGPIRGNVYKHGEKIVDGYLGIPFAKPPVGDLRFKKPVAAEKWTTPLDCYEYGPGCPQSGNFSFICQEGKRFDEAKCLTLNVFAPRWKSKEFPNGLPIFVYIHGGGFEIGYSSSLDDYSLTGTIPLRDIIVVTINYRLGPLGFLTTGDDVAKGNYGLWDQTLALKWIQQHIASFGGDPNNVTVSGTSAGGISSDMLALSPHSNKLFHRFHSISGTSNCTFVFRTKEEEAHIFKRFAKHHGYTGNDSESLLKWYQSQDASIFKECAEIERDYSGYFHFVPNFDGDFFPKPLEELRKEAPKMDAMITIGEYEGLGMIMTSPTCTHQNDNLRNLKDTITDAFGPEITKSYEEIRNKLFDIYTKDINNSDQKAIAKKLIEFIGDQMFNITALETAKSCATNGNNAYLASFDYFNKETNGVTPFGPMPFMASTHGAETQYLLGTSFAGEFNIIEEEIKVMEMVGTFASNFIKYGNPNGKNGTGKWQKFNPEHPDKYFKIDFPTSEMKDNFQNGRLKVFEELRKIDIRHQKIANGNII